MTNIQGLCKQLLDLDSTAYNIGHMKSFVAGLLTIIILGILGYLTFKGTAGLMTRLFVSPTPSASTSPAPTVSPAPTSTPKPTSQPEVQGDTTTKGGIPVKSPTGTVKGATTTKTVTTTTTTSHLTLTLVKTSACPVSYMTEVKDIRGPLTLKYSLKDGYSFGITVWKSDGNELLTNTTYSGTSGTIKTIDGVDYMKVRVESKSCSSTSDTWLTLTAER